MLTRICSDLISAWKGVRGGRGGSVVAVVALAIGIGTSVTAAAVAYAGLLRPLPFPDPDRLVTVDTIFTPTGLSSGVKRADFEQWQRQMTGAVELAALAGERATLRINGGAEEIRVAYVLGHWVDVVTRPLAGRGVGDDSPLDHAVVSHAFATRMSTGDAAEVIGRPLTIGDRTVTIVGIQPQAMTLIDAADVWMPAGAAGALKIAGQNDARWYRVVGRLEPGVSIEGARTAGAAAVRAVTPDAQRDLTQVRLQSLHGSLVGDARPLLAAFMAASILVLLVASANVATLFINRGVARAREFSVRIALGASRQRLIGVSILETLLLTLAGATGGVLVARLASSFLLKQTGLDLPAVATAEAGTWHLAGAGVAGLAVVLLCGAAPLVVLRRRTMAIALRSTTTAGSRSGRRVRGALVVVQIALTVMLLTGAGLLGRTLLSVSQSDPGLDAPARVMTIGLPLGQSLGDATARLATVQRVLDEVRRLPGVTAAGVGAALPPSQPGIVFTIRVRNDDVDASRAFDLVPVTDGYLEAAGARLVDGRLFTSADATAAEPTAVMSESAVKHLGMVTETAVGSPLNMELPTAAGPRVRPRVIGVIRDIRYSGLDRQANGGIYVRWAQLPVGRAFLLARSASDPTSLAAPLASIARTADPSLPLGVSTSFEEVVEMALASRMSRFSVVAVFGAGAALLGAIGLSGALIRSVVERQRELATRAAIGATPARLRREVVQQAALLTTFGVAAGLAGSWFGAQGAAALLHGVTPHDPLTYAATALIVFVLAVLACYVPARRAASADPALALKAE